MDTYNYNDDYHKESEVYLYGGGEYEPTHGGSYD
jgi:hypothetical protein